MLHLSSSLKTTTPKPVFSFRKPTHRAWFVNYAAHQDMLF